MAIFPLLTGRIVLSNKKSNLRKYSPGFLKHFPKKKVFGGPCIKDWNFLFDQLIDKMYAFKIIVIYFPKPVFYFLIFLFIVLRSLVKHFQLAG